MMNVAARIEVYSSIGGGAFFEALLQEWERMGWKINRHHALLEAEYRKPRRRLSRLTLRWRMYAGFAWSCWRWARVRNHEAVRVVTTNPFFAPSLVQWAAKSHGATIQLLYDLFPDALIHAGTVQKDDWIARRCAMITGYALRECAVTVFLGERIRRHAEETYGAARRSVVIPVGADGTRFRDYPPALATVPLTVLYAGQMGRMHDVETLEQTILAGIPAGLEFVFHANGIGYTNLRRRCENAPRCRWAGALSDDAWARVMRQAHVALVTMASGAEDVVMPSKTYSALVAGQAILAICPADSDLADLVRKHDCGWVVNPGDVEMLERILQEIVSDPTGLQSKRERAYAAGHQSYDCRVLAKEWEGLFATLGSDTPKRNV
jgi:glycosyltransferase involved in cell wall biosynthesis